VKKILAITIAYRNTGWRHNTFYGLVVLVAECLTDVGIQRKNCLRNRSWMYNTLRERRRRR